MLTYESEMEGMTPTLVPHLSQSHDLRTPQAPKKSSKKVQEAAGRYSNDSPNFGEEL